MKTKHSAVRCVIAVCIIVTFMACLSFIPSAATGHLSSSVTYSEYDPNVEITQTDAEYDKSSYQITKINSITVDVSDDEIERNEEVKISISNAPKNSTALLITGDTDEWHIQSLNPTASILGNPTTGDNFPYESDQEKWFNGENPSQLTVDLLATVPEGTYNFHARAINDADDVVSESSFTIEVNNSSDVSESQPENDAESQPENDAESQPENDAESQPENDVESRSQDDIDLSESIQNDTGANKQVDDTNEKNTSNEVPGFGPIVTVIAIITSSLLLARY